MGKRLGEAVGRKKVAGRRQTRNPGSGLNSAPASELKKNKEGNGAMRGRRTNTEVSELPANVTSAGRQLEVRGSWKGNRRGGAERWDAI